MVIPPLLSSQKWKSTFCSPFLRFLVKSIMTSFKTSFLFSVSFHTYKLSFATVERILCSHCIVRIQIFLSNMPYSTLTTIRNIGTTTIYRFLLSSAANTLLSLGYFFSQIFLLEAVWMQKPLLFRSVFMFIKFLIEWTWIGCYSSV